ncbi:hypothetical protein K503DRAFT_24761 [Rhizopogon vinicolor AM-OR11-026]|uniref:Uncharacterized protein n=1 Tax=Rhizopogon vinicolor AM-OR11-026 TaxID=1314800 RepID=A0A1B7MHG0_9AGAM|nr:hypothetical protein K503DRAFT_24761 [Rhizopogon vinicolor AM-OR11-026]
MKRTVEEIKRRRSVGPFGHDDLEEDAETAGIERHADAEENAEDDSEDDQQSGEEEENSDKENGRASPVRPPSPHKPKLDVSETSPDIPTPLSPTRIALDLDLEVERTPLPQLTRPTGTSRRQHTNTLSEPQTPALTSVKHLFPPPVAVPSTPAVKSVRALFRGAGKGAEMGIREEVLDGVEEMMLTPDGYRARDENVPEQVIAEEEHEQEEQERTRVAEKEKEERKPARATSRKTPVPTSAPTTAAARRRTTRAVVGPGATGSNVREFSTSRPVARMEPVPSKRAQMVLPKRAEKEKEKATAVAPELESEPAPGVSAEERDEVAPQLVVQKKPVKARLLRARKGVTTETSDEEPVAAPKTGNTSTELRTRPASTEPRTRAASTDPRTRTTTATTTRKAQVDDVDTVPKARATRSRATPVPAARSEPAKTRARPVAKPKAATTTTRAPSRIKMRSAEDEEDADDPLDSIALPEAPAPPQRTRRTRAATAPVKEEEVDVQVPGKTKSATTTRRRAAAVVDKENTPSSSKEDESERKKEVEVKRTTRTTRSRA